MTTSVRERPLVTVVITTPTVDRVLHPHTPPLTRPGGPGIYAGTAAARQGAQVLVMGGIDYRHWSLITRAHKARGLGTLFEHTGCTQRYILSYNQEGHRTARAMNRCPLTRRPLHVLRTIAGLQHRAGPHALMVIWAPLWGAREPEFTVLDHLLNQTQARVVIDLQYLARDTPRTLATQLKKAVHWKRPVWIAHADLHEALTICGLTHASITELRRCKQRLHIQELLVSNGPGKILLLTPHATHQTRPPFTVPDADPTGAGEYLLATYATQRAQDNPPYQALKTAAHHATQHVKRQTLQSRQELEKTLL